MPVFSPVVAGETLKCERSEAGITDQQTGSTWSITGRATDEPLLGSQLQRVLHGDHFWFSWAAFTPDTRVWQPAGEGS